MTTSMNFVAALEFITRFDKLEKDEPFFWLHEPEDGEGWRCMICNGPLIDGGYRESDKVEHKYDCLTLMAKYLLDTEDD